MSVLSLLNIHGCGLTAVAAIALQVQVVGSVVYSNYSVRVQVMPSPPVVFIQGGTNIFIHSRNGTVVTLDGQRSYDPDSPMSPVRYRITSHGTSGQIWLKPAHPSTMLNDFLFAASAGHVNLSAPSPAPAFTTTFPRRPLCLYFLLVSQDTTLTSSSSHSPSPAVNVQLHQRSSSH